MRRKRDTGRKKCYRAEWSIEGDERGLAFTSVAEAQEYTDLVTDDLGERPIRIKAGTRRRTRASTAYKAERKIVLAVHAKVEYHLTELTLLHEIAHVLAPWDARHCTKWRDEFFNLVRRFMGDITYRKLVEAFVREGAALPSGHEVSTKRRMEIERERVKAVRIEAGNYAVPGTGLRIVKKARGAWQAVDSETGDQIMPERDGFVYRTKKDTLRQIEANLDDLTLNRRAASEGPSE